MKRIGLGVAATVVAVSFVGAQAASAQSYLMPEPPERGVWLEVMHPNVKEPLEVTVPSTAWFASGRHTLTPRLWGVAEIPFAYGKPDIAGFSGDGSTVLGNPYLGVEFAAREGVRLELGARIPLTTADEDSFGDVVGFLADPLRGEAFVEDMVSLSGAVNATRALPNGLSVRARGGVTQAIWTGDDDEGESITFLDYGFLATYPVNTVRLAAGLAGRWDATEDEGKFSENSLHHLGFSGDMQVRALRPGISVKVPLNQDYRDVVGTQVGVYFQMPLSLTR